MNNEVRFVGWSLCMYEIFSFMLLMHVINKLMKFRKKIIIDKTLTEKRGKDLL